MIYITFERGGPKLSNATARALAQRTSVQQRQLRLSFNELTNAKNLVLHSSHFCSQLTLLHGCALGERSSGGI